MNTEGLLHLADIIESAPHKPSVTEGRKLPLTGFNMRRWHDGDVGCIGGWAAQTFGYKDGIRSDKYFGVTPELFLPWQIPMAKWGEITPGHAAAVIRNLVKTGKVDWSVQPQERMI